MSKKSHQRSSASKAGTVPDLIGVLLFALVCGAVLMVSLRLGYSTALIGPLLVSGSVAGIAVRVAATGQTWKVVTGIVLLWLATLGYVGGTGLLVVRAPSSQNTSLLVSLVLASASTLGPFGVVTNTIRSYGQGSGTTIIWQYLLGVSSLIGVAVLAAGGLAIAAITSDTTLKPGTVQSIVPANVGIRVMMSIVLYVLILLSIPSIVGSLPLEIQTEFDRFGRIRRFRDAVKRVCSYGWRGLFVFLCLSLFYPVLAFFSTLSGTKSEIAEPLDSAVLGVIEIVAHPVLISISLVIAPVFVVSVLFFKLVGRISLLSGPDIVRAGTPPVLIVLVVSLGSRVVTDKTVPENAEMLVRRYFDSGGAAYDLVVAWPSLLLFFALALIAGGLIFSVPTIVAGISPADESLVGLVASVCSLVGVVIVGVWADLPVWLLVFGVAVIAIVWEIGEYTTVATGELRSPVSTGQLPAGFLPLFSIHSLVTLTVAVAGSVIMVGSLTLVTSIATPSGMTLFALVTSVCGIAALFLLLSG